MGTVLILGGTGWLGSRVAAHAVARGDRVTCLARGTHPAPEGARLIASDRDLSGAYDEVADSPWDEVVELTASGPRAEGALDALAERASHWTLISTTSVYADHESRGQTEEGPVVEPDLEGDYAETKAAVELATLETLGDRALIVRPGLIGGGADPSDRLGYWVGRMALAGDGEVLAPEFDEQPFQVIDVDDLARFVAEAGGSGMTGVVNAVGDPTTAGEVLRLSAELAGFTGTVRRADDDWLEHKGVHYWMGPHSLPLWLPPQWGGGMTRANATYLSSGGMLRPLRETIAAHLTHERAAGLDRPRRSGLSREEEQALLAALP